MTKIPTIIAAVLLAGCASRQPGAPVAAVPAESPRAQVMVLGTFHFDDAGLDDFKPQRKIDMLSGERQQQVERLVDRLAGFKPTRIAVEWPANRQLALDSMYALYRSGAAKPSPNEINQVGFRLAKRLGHSKVYAVDASARSYGEQPTTEALIKRAQSLGQLELITRATGYLEQHNRYALQVDSMLSDAPLEQSLTYMNSPEYLRRSHAQYFVGQIEVGGNGDYIGADMRTAWYNRNIRIFTNVQRAVETKGDRVLLLIGAGHVSILRHLFQSSPEFQLVEPRDFINAGSRR